MGSERRCTLVPLSLGRPCTAPRFSLQELVGKFIPEAIGKEIEKSCQGIYPLQVGTAGWSPDTAGRSLRRGVPSCFRETVQCVAARLYSQGRPLPLIPAQPPTHPPTLQNTFVRKVKLLRAPKFDINRLMEVRPALPLAPLAATRCGSLAARAPKHLPWPWPVLPCVLPGPTL